jgi:hypothetical protein
MLKKIILSGIMISTLNAQVYTSKLESNKFVSMKSEVNGKIKKVLKMEDTLILNEKSLILQIDDTLERDKLDILSTNIEYSLLIDKENTELIKLETLIKNNIIKDSNSKISSDTYSNSQKLLFNNSKLRASKSFILENERKLQNKITLNNLRNETKILQDLINKKSIKLNRAYIYKIHVVPGEVISIGQSLFDYYDISKLKLTYFITENDFNKIQLNGINAVTLKNTKIKDYKLFKIKDNTHLGSYKLEIIVYDKLVDKIGYLFNLEVK